jgi:hypothetical protein
LGPASPAVSSLVKMGSSCRHNEAKQRLHQVILLSGVESKFHAAGTQVRAREDSGYLLKSFTNRVWAFVHLDNCKYFAGGAG